MESELKQQSQQALQGAEEAQKRSMACQARAEELARHAERSCARAQKLKDNMNKAANRTQLRSKAVDPKPRLKTSPLPFSAISPTAQ